MLNWEWVTTSMLPSKLFEAQRWPRSATVRSKPLQSFLPSCSRESAPAMWFQKTACQVLWAKCSHYILQHGLPSSVGTGDLDSTRASEAVPPLRCGSRCWTALVAAPWSNTEFCSWLAQLRAAWRCRNGLNQGFGLNPKVDNMWTFDSGCGGVATPACQWSWGDVPSGLCRWLLLSEECRLALLGMIAHQVSET